MRYLYVAICFIFLLTSCQWRDQVEVNQELLLQEELDKIDWSELDAYPSVDQCDSLVDESARRACFFNYISSEIQNRLQHDTLVSAYPSIDSLEVMVTVFPDSKITIEPIRVPDSIAFNAQMLDSVLQLRLKDLPMINPGIKRGIPVKTQFILPVILKVD